MWLFVCVYIFIHHVLGERNFFVRNMKGALKIPPVQLVKIKPHMFIMIVKDPTLTEMYKSFIQNNFLYTKAQKKWTKIQKECSESRGWKI